jgi:hypothetical protein
VKVSGILERWALSPVWWANFGVLSRAIAMRSRSSAQPVLIVAHPRSGSSWVGKTLGLTPGTRYLHEPLTLTHLRTSPGSPAFEFPRHAAPASYVRAGRKVALALPAFRPGIVSFPRQWKMLDRSPATLVVKEVNPLALPWFIECWRPKIIYLTRHPAGVAASFGALGWLRKLGRAGFLRRFPSRVATGEVDPARYCGSIWAELGAMQAIIHNAALEALREWPEHSIVTYEELCADPVAHFRRLCDFAGLDWNDGMQALIERQGVGGEADRADSYSTIRPTRRMPHLWRSELAPIEIAELKKGYLSHEPAFYGEGEW